VLSVVSTSHGKHLNDAIVMVLVVWIISLSLIFENISCVSYGALYNFLIENEKSILVSRR
jgi:hypothetical protein